MSRHLATLRDAGLVQGRREGFWIRYRIAPDLPAWAIEALDTTSAGLADQSPFSDDRDRLRNMADRPNRCATTV
ncbi:MAG: hypothetical protein U5K43_13880 [Halofilum sp. (in: g-proteobacteria)]|nr:hypothetical protein [Halofilum sp. (in: g-proteobacteria)]